MRWLRRLMRLTMLLSYLVVGLLTVLLVSGLLRQGYAWAGFRYLKRHWLAGIAYWSGARIRLYGTPCTDKVMYVANHISWLDIAVLGGLLAPRFLSKAEVQRWPIIGWLASAAGTLYIERGHSATAASQAISRALQAGEHVLLFPEGTTSNGQVVQRFFARLFAPALETNTIIQPIALRYRDEHQQPHQQVPYIGEQSFGQNIWQLMAQPAFVVEVHFLPPFSPQNLPRKTVALQAEQAIASVIHHSSNR